jgi:hypothetical protein
MSKTVRYFVRAVADYALTNNEELSLDIFVGWDGDDRFISIPED